jgi:hypothetical protein
MVGFPMTRADSAIVRYSNPGAHELGLTTENLFSDVTISQIEKDQLLIQSQQVNGVKWVFSPNAFSDVGPSGPLMDALEAAGIPGEINGPWA